MLLLEGLCDKVLTQSWKSVLLFCAKTGYLPGHFLLAICTSCPGSVSPSDLYHNCVLVILSGCSGIDYLKPIFPGRFPAAVLIGPRGSACAVLLQFSVLHNPKPTEWAGRCAIEIMMSRTEKNGFNQEKGRNVLRILTCTNPNFSEPALGTQTSVCLHFLGRGWGQGQDKMRMMSTCCFHYVLYKKRENVLPILNETFQTFCVPNGAREPGN
jgi:hypothetical protein